MTNVLYCSENSNYNDFPVFTWTEKENALLYRGDNSVIAHPPCRLFSRLRKFSKAQACEQFMAISAIALVRRVGGIVEHPRSSTLWEKMRVGTPKFPDSYGGYIISINLHWFGFKAEKKTCLYIVGVNYKDLPPLPLNFDRIDYSIRKSKKSRKKELAKSKRAETPPQLIEWMLKIISFI